VEKWATAGQKEKGWNGLAGLNEGIGFGFIFFSSIFNPLLKNLFKFFKKTFKLHNQTKVHAFNMMHKHLGIFYIN
jgi:hypothetical protein